MLNESNLEAIVQLFMGNESLEQYRNHDNMPPKFICKHLGNDLRMEVATQRVTVFVNNIDGFHSNVTKGESRNIYSRLVGAAAVMSGVVLKKRREHASHILESCLRLKI